MPRTSATKYTDQDRDDLQTLHDAIQKALLVEVDSTVSAVQLGAYLKELKDRSLWKLELNGKRGSFYRWVHERHKIKTTMIKNYLLIGTALTPSDVSGRRISVKSLQVISSAELDLRSYLIRLADAQQSSTKVKRALQAAREALAQGASLSEAQTRGEAAMDTRGKRSVKAKGAPSPLAPPSLTIEEALQQALEKLKALGESEPGKEPLTDLAKVESLAQDVLASVRKLKEQEAKPRGSVTAVTDPADPSNLGPKLWMVPLAVVVRALVPGGFTGSAKPTDKESPDIEYLLRFPRPPTSVPLAIPPDVPPVPRSLADQIEPLLNRVSGLLNGKKVLTQKELDQPLVLAAQALEIARGGVLGLHPLLCRPLEWLSFLGGCCGDLDYAERLTREILEIWQKYDTKDQGQVLEWQSCLGIVLLKQGRIAEARSLFTRVFQKRQRSLPKDHPLYKLAQENLALVTPRQTAAHLGS